MMCSFESITFNEKTNYLFRNYDGFVQKYDLPPPKQKKEEEETNTYLLRKYTLFIQEYDKVTPTWGELTFLNAFWGSSLKCSFPKGAP